MEPIAKASGGKEKFPVPLGEGGPEAVVDGGDEFVEEGAAVGGFGLGSEGDDAVEDRVGAGGDLSIGAGLPLTEDALVEEGLEGPGLVEVALDAAAEGPGVGDVEGGKEGAQGGGELCLEVGDLLEEAVARALEDVVEALAEELDCEVAVVGFEDEASEESAPAAESVGDLAFDAEGDEVEAIGELVGEGGGAVVGVSGGVGDELAEGVGGVEEFLEAVDLGVSGVIDVVEEGVEGPRDLGDLDLPGALDQLLVEEGEELLKAGRVGVLAGFEGRDGHDVEDVVVGVVVEVLEDLL